MVEILEKDIQSGILKWLRKTYPRAAVFKLHEDSVFGTVGLPDILFIWDGEVYFFEVKQPGEIPTPKQISVMAKLKSNKVSVHIVTSVEQVKQIVRR